MNDAAGSDDDVAAAAAAVVVDGVAEADGHGAAVQTCPHRWCSRT